MITAHEPNDPDSPRVARHLHRFRGTPAPAASDWAGWDALLADRSGDAGEQINIVPRGDYGTVCSSLVELVPDRPPVWLFAAGAPHLVAFETVRLAG